MNTFFKHMLVLMLIMPAIGLAGDRVSPETAVILEEITTEMDAAMLANDYRTLLANYTEDCVVMPDFQPPIRGRQAMRRVYAENEKSGVVTHAFSGKAEARWEVDGMVYERGTFGMTVSDRQHPHPRGYYGSYFQIWERQGSTYRLAFVIWNLDHPPH